MRLDFEHARRRRQFEQEARDRSGGGLRFAEGDLQFPGTGQSLVYVPFGCRFIEFPIHSFGAALDEGGNTQLAEGNFPTISVMIHTWDYIQVRPGLRHYKGANLIIVTTGGDSGTIVNVHYRFEGKAIGDPFMSDGGITE